MDISNQNIEEFSVSTNSQDKIKLFEGVCKYIIDQNKRNSFAKDIIAKLLIRLILKWFLVKSMIFSRLFLNI